MKKISLLVISILLVMAIGVPVLAYQEAPMLKEKVGKGELPPVNERLPEEPLVLPVRNKIGEYGGTMNVASVRIPPMGGYNIGNFSGQTLLFYAGGLRDTNGEIVTNIAKDYKVNEDFTEFTFYLRKGLKWSDGHPYTTEDISFYWNHVLKNTEFTPTLPDAFKQSDGSPMKLKIIDKYTFKFVTDVSNPFFLHAMASTRVSGGFCLNPKHYMKQFHQEFTTEKELKTILDKEGFDNWIQLYEAKMGSHKSKSNPEKPRLAAWIPKKVPPKSPPWTWERNPYFWAVDEEGNQLPYIDTIRNRKLNVEVKRMRAMAGKVDMAWAVGFDMISEFKQKEEQGNFKLALWDLGPNVNWHAIFFNHISEDKDLRKIFNNKKFKIAVSHAINREELNNLFMYGYGEISQAKAPSGTKVYEATKKLYKKYTEFNPEKAKKLLNEMGLDKKSKNGYRLRPDGKELFLNIVTYQEDWAKVNEVIASQLREVGINASVKLINMSIFQQKLGNNEIDVCGLPAGNISITMVGAWQFAPIDFSSRYAPAYGSWYSSNGETGIKPKGSFMTNLERYKQLIKETDPEKRFKLRKKMVETVVNELWYIGTFQRPPILQVIGSKLENVPGTGYPLMGEGIFSDTARPETYFFKEE